MVRTNAHKYAQNGELIDLQREIQRDRNVVHEKDEVRAISIIVIICVLLLLII
jgi:hypothetical protein